MLSAVIMDRYPRFRILTIISNLTLFMCFTFSWNLLLAFPFRLRCSSTVNEDLRICVLIIGLYTGALCRNFTLLFPAITPLEGSGRGLMTMTVRGWLTGARLSGRESVTSLLIDVKHVVAGRDVVGRVCTGAACMVDTGAACVGKACRSSNNSAQCGNMWAAIAPLEGSGSLANMWCSVIIWWLPSSTTEVELCDDVPALVRLDSGNGTGSFVDRQALRRDVVKNLTALHVVGDSSNNL